MPKVWLLKSSFPILVPALLIHLSSEERIDALLRKWSKLSGGGNLEHKLKPLL
jgi:hypothetical protein